MASINIKVQMHTFIHVHVYVSLNYDSHFDNNVSILWKSSIRSMLNTTAVGTGSKCNRRRLINNPSTTTLLVNLLVQILDKINEQLISKGVQIS